jgi:hypothetical protein
MQRDYFQEMNNYLELMIPDGDYVAQIVGQDIVNTLLEEDPDLLMGWLKLRASSVLTGVISRRSNSNRQKLRIRSQRSAFAEAANRFTAERDPVVLSPFAFEYVVNLDNVRRKVGRMTSSDCQFVAARYEDTARNARMRSAFHRAVAQKLGDGQTVEDVFTEDEYLRMFQSLTNEIAPRSPKYLAA